MRVPCYILVATDPQTGTTNPFACNEDYATLKQVKQEAIDNLELTATTMSPRYQMEIATTCASFRIVPGYVDFDDE